MFKTIETHKVGVFRDHFSTPDMINGPGHELEKHPQDIYFDINDWVDVYKRQDTIAAMEARLTALEGNTDNYLTKANVINEYNYSKIETDIYGWNDHQIDPEVFNKILRLGCTIRAFRESNTNERWDGRYLPAKKDYEIIEKKTWVFVHEDITSNLSIRIYYHGYSELNDKMICQIHGLPGLNSIIIESLAIEEGSKFNSYNVYCKEIVDAKLS